MPDDIKLLSLIAPFRHLPKEELHQLIEKSQEKTYPKGACIFTEGEDADGIWVLKRGRVEILKYNTNGKPHAFEVIKPGELFGTYCRIEKNDGEYPCTAMTASPVSAYWIPNDVIQNFFGNQAAFTASMCKLCSGRLNEMKESMISAHESVEIRIVKILLRLIESDGAILSYTKREISEFAATTVETTIRTLKTFENKKWISSSRGKITINDSEKLKSLLA